MLKDSELAEIKKDAQELGDDAAFNAEQVLDLIARLESAEAVLRRLSSRASVLARLDLGDEHFSQTKG